MIHLVLVLDDADFGTASPALVARLYGSGDSASTIVIEDRRLCVDIYQDHSLIYDCPSSMHQATESETYTCKLLDNKIIYGTPGTARRGEHRLSLCILDVDIKIDLCV